MYFLLLLLWIIYNGRITLEVVLIGSLVAGAVYWFICTFMSYKRVYDKKILKNISRYLSLTFVLIIQILKSSIPMLLEIFMFKKEIKPEIVKFKSPVKKISLQVALANCITLTPGTYTLKVENDEITVYGLSSKAVENIEKSVYANKLKELDELEV